MSIIVDGSKARTEYITDYKKCDDHIQPGQGVFYLTRKSHKLGQVTRSSAVGLTPGEAFVQRYSDKSSMTENHIAKNLFIFDLDEKKVENFSYDNEFRKFIHQLHRKGEIPFDALYPGYQKEGFNSECLIGYDADKHHDYLVKALKQYFGLGEFFITKKPALWKYEQENDVENLVRITEKYGHSLYSAHTGRGKTIISLGAAFKICKNGGVVFITTPITDTIQSFKNNLNDYFFGDNRNVKVNIVDSQQMLDSQFVKDMRRRADAGEIFFILRTVQDVRYDDNNDGEIREKYSQLDGIIDLWVRDEYHKEYNGGVTQKRLEGIDSKYILDLTATPYKIIDQYDYDQIVSRSLLWALKNIQYTKIPSIKIDAFNTPFPKNEKTAGLYDETEGFDPRKLFIRESDNFVYAAELEEICRRMYEDTQVKPKNRLSIRSDFVLSLVAKKCGMWVCPSGQNGDGSADYLPNLAALLNATPGNTYYVDSYTAEKEAIKLKITIGDYIEGLITKHGRVIILTCRKFLVGTDIPCLGHIVLMTKMEDAANFEQLLGRLIRVYPGKDTVKLYTFTPGMSIILTLGLMAKANAKLNQGVSEKEFLIALPLTMYNLDKPEEIKVEYILKQVQEYIKGCCKSRLPDMSLREELTNLDPSLYEKLTLNFKKGKNKIASITKKNSAKVSNGNNNGQKNSKSNGPDNNKLVKFAELVQNVMNEARWVAYSRNDYNYDNILRNNAIVDMFGQEEMNAVICAIDQKPNLRVMVKKFFSDNEIAFKNQDLELICDDVFRNSEYKQKLGLVYTTFSLVNIIIDKLPDIKYNFTGRILVVNALNGTFALKLREKFPNAEIVCIEFNEYFRDHLTRLGFTVIKWDEIDNMKNVDVIIGNPPYQDGERKDAANKLWPQVVVKANEILNDNGTVAFITPISWMQPTADIGKGSAGTNIFRDIFKKNNFVYADIDSEKLKTTYFSTVGSTFSYFVYQKNNYAGKTRVNTSNGVVDIDISKMNFLPKELSVESINIMQKMNGVPFDFEDQNHNLNGDESPSQDTDHIYKIYHTNAKGGKYIYGEKINPYANLPKVIVSLSGEYKAIVDTEHGFSNMCCAIICSDISEANNTQNILNSKLYRFWIEMQKFSGFVPRKILLSLPMINQAKLWDSKEIYSHFGLTQNEIDYIEKEIK
jgi:hypothetical protein